MGCRLIEWKERATINEWSPEDLNTITGGVCACNFHKVIHTRYGDIPFEGETNNEKETLIT